MRNGKVFLIAAIVSILACSSAAAQVLPAAETESASLFVEANVKNAEVYLNGVFMGLTPLTIRPVEPGIWQLTVRKDGYYQESWTIKIAAGEQKKIAVDLEPVTGTLIIDNAPAKAEFVIGEKTYRTRKIELPEGKQDILVRAFGYTEKTVVATIHRRTETVIDGKLERAAFAVSDLRPMQVAFNPDNPSNLGKNEITFQATAPGTAEIRILSPSGETLKLYTTTPFTTWKQSLRWDGTDETGKRVTDGAYAIEVIAREIPAAESSAAVKPADGTTADGTTAGDATADANGQPAVRELRSTVVVDGSIFYPFTESFIGTGASGSVVSGSLMPKYGALVQFDTLAVGSSGRPGVFGPGLSALVGVTDRLEAGVRTGVLVGSSTENAVDVSAALKAGFAKGGLHSALALRYSFLSSTIPETGPAIRRGLSFGPAAEYRFPRAPAGTLSLGGHAEVSWGSEAGFFADAYASVSGGLAARLVSGPVATALWVHAEAGETATAGGSLAWIIPSTNLVLSAQGGYQWSEKRADSFLFRGGFGFMF